MTLLILNSHPINEAALRQIASKIIKAIPFTHITHLELRLGTHPTPISWRTVMKGLPSLRMVYIQSTTGAVNFPNALIEVEATDPARRTYPRIRGNPLEVLEIDERHYCLENHKTAVEALFPFVGEKMVRMGEVYDPVKRKEERAKRLRLRAAAMGVKLPQDAYEEIKIHQIT
ncbi:hypothetical protein B0H17DRAFT_1201285 [Mycena rosella]|uniref:Uncharacterized protein n=1 Tax=Mycena rosella TaxID=1033263 RepID=A0AAD7DH07_MYCRO|nr:hypothetical protein B0H17DRAFT_1201285 [Mycena rosella]